MKKMNFNKKSIKLDKSQAKNGVNYQKDIVKINKILDDLI